MIATFDLSLSLSLKGSFYFTIFHTLFVKCGTDLCIKVFSSLYARPRLHQLLADLHFPSNKVYYADAKLNPIIQPMLNLTCAAMILSGHILPKGFHNLLVAHSTWFVEFSVNVSPLLPKNDYN